MTDLDWMKEAYALACKAQSYGEVPVGAVLVDEHQRRIGQGFNQVILGHDPSLHAEIVALRDAATYVKNYRLPKTTLYVTLEPCCMCAGALVHARVARLVFATRDVKAGAAGSQMNLLKGFPLNHQVEVEEGLMADECRALLRDFFKLRR